MEHLQVQLVYRVHLVREVPQVPLEEMANQDLVAYQELEDLKENGMLLDKLHVVTFLITI